MEVLPTLGLSAIAVSGGRLGIISSHMEMEMLVSLDDDERGSTLFRSSFLISGGELLVLG